jgi:hypothetical protein
MAITGEAYLQWLSGVFRDAPRHFFPEGNPQGETYISFDDEIAVRIADDLQKLSDGQGVLTYEN